MTEPLTGLALIARADAYRAEVLRRKRIGLLPVSFAEWLEREGVDEEQHDRAPVRHDQQLVFDHDHFLPR